jgi:hypothetical protein
MKKTVTISESPHFRPDGAVSPRVLDRQIARDDGIHPNGRRIRRILMF